MSSPSTAPTAVRTWWTPSIEKESDRLRIFSTYDLYPKRSFDIRSLSITIFFVEEHVSLRSISRTIFWRFGFRYFILYDILTYNLYPVPSFSFTSLCHYEHYTLRTLSPTVFWQTNFFLRTFGVRKIFIQSFVRTPSHGSQTCYASNARRRNCIEIALQLCKKDLKNHRHAQ